MWLHDVKRVVAINQKSRDGKVENNGSYYQWENLIWDSPNILAIQKTEDFPFPDRDWNAYVLLADSHQLNGLPLHCVLGRVACYRDASYNERDILTFSLVPFIFSTAHLFSFALGHGFNAFLRGLPSLWRVFLAPLFVLGILRQLPLVD